MESLCQQFSQLYSFEINPYFLFENEQLGS